jgi:hypothetical protein
MTMNETEKPGPHNDQAVVVLLSATGGSWPGAESATSAPGTSITLKSSVKLDIGGGIK